MKESEEVIQKHEKERQEITQRIQTYQKAQQKCQLLKVDLRHVQSVCNSCTMRIGSLVDGRVEVLDHRVE